MSARFSDRRAMLIAGAVIIALAGCAPGEALSASPHLQPSASAIARTQTPTISLAPSTSTTAGRMPLNEGCSPSDPCRLSAGTWILTGKYSFILGMQVTVPEGWESREQDAGEFNLFPLDHPDDHILMVKDIAAIKTDGSLEVVPDIPRTAEGLTTYWRHDPNLVVSPSKSTTIADGIDALTYVITISPQAKFIDKTCPVYPHCADLFTDPRYWGGGGYGIGAPGAVRLYLATVGTGDDSHLFVIGLEGANDAALARLTEEAAPIIASIRLPSSMKVW